MGQRTDDILFAIYEQLVELNAKTEAHSGELGLIRSKLQILAGRRLPETGVESTIAPQLDPGYLPKRSSNTGDPRLSESISQYLDLKKHEVSPQHLNVMRLTLFHMVPAIEAFTVGQVIRSDIEARRQALLDEGRSIKTVNNHIAIIHAYFEYLIAEGYVEENPARGLKIRNRGRASRQRKAFTPEQIKHVFDGLLTRVETSTSYHARRWLPLIMLYTGARPEEVAQLRVGDVRRVPIDRTQPYSADPISPETPRPPLWGGPTKWVFDFATMDDGQRRKSEASRRLVPVHIRLWHLGFGKILAKRDADELIFPELNPGANGRLAEAPSRWFNRKWLRDVKQITDKKLVLYSLRHSVATALKHAGAEDSVVSQLLGHADSSITTGRYGKEYPVEKLAEVVDMLDWEV